MNLCSNGHDEVCYEGRNCPVCEMEAEKDKEIEQRDKEIADYESLIEDLNEQIDKLGT